MEKIYDNEGILTLARFGAVALRSPSLAINSCDLYASSGHFLRLGSGGSPKLDAKSIKNVTQLLIEIGINWAFKFFIFQRRMHS